MGGNMGLFLLCWVYLRKVQQQDRACVCRGEREETKQEAQPGQSISWRIYLVPPWSRLPSAEQIKLHLPLAGTSSLMPAWLQISTSVLELTLLTLEVVRSLAFPFQHTANEKLLAGFKVKGSGLAVLCWKLMSAHPRRRHHFRNFQLVHHPPPA